MLRLVLLSRLQTGWTGSSESEVGQMEVSRGSDQLAGGPPSIPLLERHWSQQSGNLLSSQACSFTSDETCYQGELFFFFLTVGNSAMIVSIHCFGVRVLGFAAAQPWV